jgi:hypothetical protein
MAQPDRKAARRPETAASQLGNCPGQSCISDEWRPRRTVITGKSLVTASLLSTVTQSTAP